jgi:hypothetical protein
MSVLSQSNLGKAILQMVELRTSTHEFDFGKLFTALDELTESLEERKHEEGVSFSQDKQQYLSDQAFYQNKVTQYTNEEAQHSVDLEALKNDREWLESFLAKKIEELAEARRLKEQVESTMAKNEAVYTVQMRDYDDAISVIDQVLDLLAQA